jgi:hypothetical protein
MRIVMNMKADFDTKTAICKKCNHVDAADFTKACLFDKKESSGSRFKMAYLSCLFDVKRAENERLMISVR